MKNRLLPLLFFLLLAALWLSSCAPAATAEPAEVPKASAPAQEPPQPEQPASQPPQPTQVLPPPTEEAPKEETSAGESAAGPAPSATALTQDTQQSTPSSAEPSTGAPSPTQPLIEPSPVAPLPVQAVESRLVELEWPARMRLGESDIVRLALTPYEEGYIVEAEFPEHQIQSQAVQVERLAGYTLAAIARLDGVGFEIQPGGDQRQFLPANQPLTWRWTLRPLAPGQQRLAVMVLLEWLPDPGVQSQERQALLFSRGLDVRVVSFLGLTQGQAMAGGFFGLIFSGGLGLFTLIYRPRAAAIHLRMVKPNEHLVVEPNPGMKVSPVETGLISALFRRYARVSLVSEFLSGYSGARAFLALPVRPDGRSDAYTIVKIGPRQDIQQEYENYEAYVRDSLPPMTARIQHVPVALRGSEQAALQYTFLAEPGRLPVSLRLALRQKPDPELLYRLFNSFGPNWWLQREPYTFRLGEEYDCLLPPHYILEPVTAGSKALPLLEDTRSPGGLWLVPGNTLLVSRFPRAEKRRDGVSLTLSGHPQPGQPPLRLRWLGATPPDRTPGRVSSTRAMLLAEYARGFDRYGLPDPLERLEDLLNEPVIGTRSIIHGDLNLENVLVGPGDLVWLIDFAQTRMGHPLFDFARLAAEIIAHVLAARIGSGKIYLDTLSAGDPLLKAIEEIAGNCLSNPAVRREYHLALYVACLGALKFTNLDRRQKHLLYLTAAYMCLGL